MLYAPFATYRKAVGVSGEGKVLSVEDPVVVGIIGEGCLDAVDCGRNICGSQGRYLDGHFWWEMC